MDVKSPAEAIVEKEPSHKMAMKCQYNPDKDNNNRAIVAIQYSYYGATLGTQYIVLGLECTA